MNTRACLESLTMNGDIPQDAQVVSTNNKIVAISQSEGIVARISDLCELKTRDDPHDLRYSHRAAWLSGDSASVVKPFQEHPQISGQYIISSYPLLNIVTGISPNEAPNVYAMTRDFGAVLDVVAAGMILRRLDVSEYVGERVDYMQDNSTYDSGLVTYLHDELEKMNNLSPFTELTQADAALVHGDLKMDNIVTDHSGNLKLIDLDAVAIGPKLYDLASWRLRAELGDDAPVEAVSEAGRQRTGWSEDVYRSLIGWKALSSMSFTLRYEAPEIANTKVPQIAHAASSLGALATIPTTAV